MKCCLIVSPLPYNFSLNVLITRSAELVPAEPWKVSIIGDNRVGAGVRRARIDSRKR
jgi:hypothetical protein